MRILLDSEALLGTYSVTVLEISADVDVQCDDELREKRDGLIGRLAKPRHYRGSLRVKHTPCKNVEQRRRLEKKGKLDEPTFYIDDDESEFKLKVYVRKAKRPGGEHGGHIVRIEWTLNEAAITRYLGGKQICNLLALDLDAFVAEHLHIVETDFAKIGKLVVRKVPKWRPENAGPDYWPKLIGRRFGQVHAARQCAEFHHETLKLWERALVTWSSPAQLRGKLLEMMATEEQRLQDKCKGGTVRLKPKLTPYKIGQCFKRKRLRRRLLPV